MMLETPGSISESLFDSTCKSFLSTIGWLGKAAANASLLVGCRDGDEGHSGINPCGMAPCGGAVGSGVVASLAKLSPFDEDCKIKFKSTY